MICCYIHELKKKLTCLCRHLCVAGLVLKLQELISKVPIPRRDEGFTKPGPYIYEMLKSLNITHETAPNLISTLEEATVLLDEKLRKGTNAGSKLEIIVDMLKLIFRENGSSHADVYRVSAKQTLLLLSCKDAYLSLSLFVRFMSRSMSKILLIS